MNEFNAREQELISQLAELQRMTPDVSLEELTLEQLAELQRVLANVAEVTDPGNIETFGE